MASLPIVIETSVHRGLWCSTCMLPSRVRLNLLRLSDEGVTLVRSLVWCTEEHEA